MMRVAKGISTAHDMVEWLHDNIRVCSKPDKAPHYASFLNDTVQWIAVDKIWKVTCKPKMGTIDLELTADTETETLVKLKWS